MLRTPISRRKVALLGSCALVLVAGIVATAIAVTAPGAIFAPIDPGIHVIGTKAGTAASQGHRMPDTEIAAAAAEAAKAGPNGPNTVGSTPNTHKGPDLMNSDPAPSAKVTGAPADVTDSLMENFGTTVAIIGHRVSSTQPGQVVVTTDPCLVDWSKTALPIYNGRSFLGTVQACGTTAAVFVAGTGMGDRDFAGRAADSASTDVNASAARDVLFGKTGLNVGAAATPDGSAVIMVATAAH